MKKLLGVLLMLHVLAGRAEDPRAAAIAAFNQGNYAQASAQLKLLHARTPLDAELLYYLGRSQHEQKQAEQAVTYLREAVRLALGNAEYHYRLGVALATYVNDVSFFKKMGVASEIKAAFVRAVEINPDFLDAREALMTFYLSAPGIAGGSEDKAREQAREIKLRNPVRGYIADARILIKQDKIEEAVAAYKVAIEAAPKESDARFEFGVALLERKRYDEALVQFSELIKEKPQESRAHYQLGKTAVLTGQQLDRGEQALKTYLDLGPQKRGDPPRAAAHWRLGMIYAAQQRKDAAKAEYQAALKLDPEFKEARASLDALK